MRQISISPDWLWSGGWRSFLGFRVLSSPAVLIIYDQFLLSSPPSVRPQTQSMVIDVRGWTRVIDDRFRLFFFPIEKEQVSKFASLMGAVVSDMWSKEVTHVIASTDENGAAKRTVKFLMGILEGKWIIKKDWIDACTKERRPVQEDHFEVTHDNHGIYIGPKHNRARVAKKARKLFKGRRFYFSGEFLPASKIDLEALVLATGGVVLHREPVAVDLEGSEVHSCIIVVYSVEFSETISITDRDIAVQHRYLKAKSLADAAQAQVEAHSWLINSIAACLL